MFPNLGSSLIAMHCALVSGPQTPSSSRLTSHLLSLQLLEATRPILTSTWPASSGFHTQVRSLSSCVCGPGSQHNMMRVVPDNEISVQRCVCSVFPPFVAVQCAQAWKCLFDVLISALDVFLVGLLDHVAMYCNSACLGARGESLGFGQMCRCGRNS